jgi:hypothetical protein
MRLAEKLDWKGLGQAIIDSFHVSLKVQYLARKPDLLTKPLHTLHVSPFVGHEGICRSEGKDPLLSVTALN